MRILCLPVIVFCCSIASCMNPPEPFTEKRIIVAGKSTVTISEVNLQITNNGCGRKWESEGDEPAYEKPFCELIFKRNGTTVHGGSDFKPIYIGNIHVEIEQINPWGRTEDSIPPGGCRILVKRMEGR